MKRRTWLAAGAGTLVAGFSTGCSLPVIPRRPAPSLDDAQGWVRYANGRYTLWLPRVEMGQNIATGLKQVACEELGVGWDEVIVRLPGTRDFAPVRATVGSDSMASFALPLAQACAALREAVAAGRTRGMLEVPPRPATALRAFAAGEARFVGQAPPLEHGEAIVRGRPLYVADVRRPGMVFGRVLRAPASPELASSLAGMSEAAARSVAGCVAIVRDERLRLGNAEGLGIVARTPRALERVEAALDARWQVAGGFEQADIDAAMDIDRRLQRGALAHTPAADRLDDPHGVWDVDLRFDIPLAAHAAIEPRAAVAEFDAGRSSLQLWVGSQDVFYQRDVMARRFGLDPERITVHAHRVGGAFGGKTLCTVELEAAVLAWAAGAPVKVQWTRAQEFRHGFHRPPSSHRVRVRLREGRIDQWWHAFASSHILFTNAAMPAWMQRFTDFAGDNGVARGAVPPYRARLRRVEFDLVRPPVFCGPWRGLGAGPNNLVIESVIDECARRAAQDAVSFRLQHIDDPRLARVLERAAQQTPRASVPAASVRQGRGVACGIYKAMSYAAVVADVEVDAAGQVRVMRLVCAHDCGRVVNPDQVRAQCEGNLVWGLGMVLHDNLPVAASQVAAATFADAPIPRFTDVPPMQVHLVDGGDAPTGAGETAIVAAAGAIANAIRDATGHRPGRFPVRAADLRASDA